MSEQFVTVSDWRVTWRSIIVPLLTRQDRDGDAPVWTTPYWATPYWVIQIDDGSFC